MTRLDEIRTRLEAATPGDAEAFYALVEHAPADLVFLLAEIARLRLDVVRAELAHVYRPDGEVIWLHAPNPLLDGQVPADLIATDNGYERVRALILVLAGGVTT